MVGIINRSPRDKRLWSFSPWRFSITVQATSDRDELLLPITFSTILYLYQDAEATAITSVYPVVSWSTTEYAMKHHQIS